MPGGSEALRVPPHSVDAEQAVLGGVLIDNDAWDRIADIVTAAHFYRNDHRAVFGAVASLCDEGQPCDAVTVAERLDRDGSLESSGGLAYLADLAQNTPNAANIVAYAEIVRERAVLRSLIRTSTEIAEVAFRPQGRAAHEVLDEAERRILEIAESAKRGHLQGPRPVQDVVRDLAEHLDAHKQRTAPVGIQTGFADLDAFTTGLHSGNLVVLAARPGVGKSALATSIIDHVVMAPEPRAVAMFSLEMTSREVMVRLVSARAGIDGTKLRTADLDDNRLVPYHRGAACLRVGSAPHRRHARTHPDRPSRALQEVEARLRHRAPGGGLPSAHAHPRRRPSSRRSDDHQRGTQSAGA